MGGLHSAANQIKFKRTTLQGQLYSHSKLYSENLGEREVILPILRKSFEFRLHRAGIFKSSVATGN